MMDTREGCGIWAQEKGNLSRGPPFELQGALTLGVSKRAR